MFDTGRLGDLIKHHIGGGTPSRAAASFWEGGIPWASVKDFEDGVTELSNTQESISEEGLNTSSSNLIPAGNLIICSRMAVGRAAICTNDTAINQDLKAIFPYEDVDIRYLLHLINWLRPKIESRSLGSTVKGIRVADLLAVPCSIAPSNEQPFIAQTIDTLDTQIRETESIIAKLQQVKQGLLHDLLTRGVDENGELRPSYDDAPELYQSSELGWIPKDWEVIEVADVCEQVIDCKNRTPPETELGYAVVKTSNIKKGCLIESSLTYTDRASYNIWTARGKPRTGDVVITREAPIGESFVITDQMPPLCLGQRTMLYRPDMDKIKPEYLHLFIRFEQTQRRLIELAGGSTVGHVRVGEIKSFLILKPKFEEQEVIAEKVLGLNARLYDEVSLFEKLKLKKSGLMDDLLTGKKRVTDLLP